MKFAILGIVFASPPMSYAETPQPGSKPVLVPRRCWDGRWTMASRHLACTIQLRTRFLICTAAYKVAM